MIKIKVFIVQGSKTLQQELTTTLRSARHIQVLGVASDPYDAREPIKKLNPDVLILDLETATRRAMTFLRNLMRLRPMPVVGMASLTTRMAVHALTALEIGAVNVVATPPRHSADAATSLDSDINNAVTTAMYSFVRPRKPVAKPVTRTQIISSSNRPDLIAIGASTGGVEAIHKVVCALPVDAPPCVIAQHIPPAFSTSFARRLNEMAQVDVCEATNGMEIVPGRVYLAPGDYHLEVARGRRGWFCRLTQEERVNFHRPSVDVLFDSLAKLKRVRIAAALLTGMGKDGARGLKAIHQSGGNTIAQDEVTSVVWGMPGFAVSINAAERVLPLESIAASLMNGRLCQVNGKKRSPRISVSKDSSRSAENSYMKAQRTER